MIVLKKVTQKDMNQSGLNNALYICLHIASANI